MSSWGTRPVFARIAVVPQRQVRLKTEEQLLAGRKTVHAHARVALANAIESLTCKASGVSVYADVQDAKDPDMVPLTVSCLLNMLYGEVGSPLPDWSTLVAPNLQGAGFVISEATTGAGRTRVVLDIVLVTTIASKTRRPVPPSLSSCTGPADDEASQGQRRKKPADRVQDKAWKVTMMHWPKDAKTGLYATMHPKSSVGMRAPEWAIDLCEKVYKAAVKFYAAEDGIDPVPILAEFTYHDFRRAIQT